MEKLCCQTKFSTLQKSSEQELKRAIGTRQFHLVYFGVEHHRKDIKLYLSGFNFILTKRQIWAYTTLYCHVDSKCPLWVDFEAF